MTTTLIQLPPPSLSHPVAQGGSVCVFLLFSAVYLCIIPHMCYFPHFQNVVKIRFHLSCLYECAATSFSDPILEERAFHAERSMFFPILVNLNCPTFFSTQLG